jgi:phage shock protein PspC (stress-responsive transcriptional regulator)
MRTLIPILSVLLALFAAGSIAYIAWKLTSDKPDRQAADPPNNSGEPD